jgi:hypothetical protein
MKNGEEKESKGVQGEEADDYGLDIIEEIEIEDFAVDGICGVY